MANRTEYYNEYIKEHYTKMTIYIQEEEWGRFKACCKKNGVSMASVVRDIMEEHMKGGEVNG